MRLILRGIGYSLLASVGLLRGQGPTLVGAGYTDPSYIWIAPGQVTTLFVAGLKTALPSDSITATTLPLPYTLTGISVTISQNDEPPSRIPLLSIRRLEQCLGATASCQSTGVTAITVQIPFELRLPEGGLQTTRLAINEAGAVSQTFTVLPVAVNLHILKSWDAFPFPRPYTGNAVVAHSDGTPVSGSSPAKAGETVVIYAFGLGRTTPAVKTGNATPTPAPPLPGTTVLAALFDFRPNAQPSNPYLNPNVKGVPAPTLPAFVGLTPGEVGLYQLNLKLPEIIPAVAPCSPELGIASNLTINIASRDTLSLIGPPSFDGAQICVQPGQ